MILFDSRDSGGALGVWKNGLPPEAFHIGLLMYLFKIN